MLVTYAGVTLYSTATEFMLISFCKMLQIPLNARQTFFVLYTQILNGEGIIREITVAFFCAVLISLHPGLPTLPHHLSLHLFQSA